MKQNAVSDDVTDDEHQQRMTRGDHELDFGMMLEAKLVQAASGLTSLRVFVRDVTRSGAAQRHGIVLSCACRCFCASAIVRTVLELLCFWVVCPSVFLSMHTSL